MDVRESLRTILEALHDLKKYHVSRQCLIDFIRGNESKEITEHGLDTLESFGSGDKREESHYNLVIDQAIDEKILKISDNNITATAKGERFRKSPTPFILKDESEEEEPGENDNALLDSLEHLVERGTKFDITYFVDEVIEKECQDELLDYFDEVDGNVDKAIEEFYGVYRPEEIRLVRLIWKP